MTQSDNQYFLNYNHVQTPRHKRKDWHARFKSYIQIDLVSDKSSLKQSKRRRGEVQSLVDLLMRDLWMWGITPPPAMVPLIRVSSSSSPRMASWRCLGVIRFTFRSLLALPASSRTSAVRYSRMAAEYTAAVAPTRPLAAILVFSCRWIRPTGN